MAIGWSITEADVHGVAEFLISSGLQAAGYTFVNSDDGAFIAQTTCVNQPLTPNTQLAQPQPSTKGWSAHRLANGTILPDPARWPHGLPAVSAYLHARGLFFGVYTSASTVACSGRPGSLFTEVVDAQSFAEWGIDYIKVDNCAQYAYGNSRYFAFADAVNASQHAMVISTEPFTIVPTPLQGAFSNLYRTTNDVEASYQSAMNRLDLNANWLPLAGPGSWADPDCIMCGHGGVNEAQCRSIFAVAAVSKSPLLLGAVLQNMTAATLATVSNPRVIAVNQDALGVPGRKLAAASGRVSPMHVGLAPCTTDNAARGVNGVSRGELLGAPRARAAPNGTVSLVHAVSGRCLAARAYMKRPQLVPVLLPCDDADLTQAWALPRATSMTPLVNAALNLSLAAGESTVWGGLHGRDNATVLLDAAFGLTNLTFEATVIEPPCTNRDCDGYEPRQSWYWSPSTGRLSLALLSSNNYACYEGSAGCYDFTGKHLPAVDDFCLSRVLAISNDGLDTDASGVHAWGGPLAGGAFVIALENRDTADAPAAVARWAWLEAPGVGDATAFCVRELYADSALGVFTGGLTLPLPGHDAVVLRLSPGATC